jgi:hypothetical protein
MAVRCSADSFSRHVQQQPQQVSSTTYLQEVELHLRRVSCKLTPIPHKVVLEQVITELMRSEHVAPLDAGQKKKISAELVKAKKQYISALRENERFTQGTCDALRDKELEQEVLTFLQLCSVLSDGFSGVLLHFKDLLACDQQRAP